MPDSTRTYQVLTCKLWSLFGRICFVAFTAAILAIPTLAHAEMSKQQQAEIANKALTAFDNGVQLAGKQRLNEANRSFEDAANLFESLVDDGVNNGMLFYNLGNTYLHLGETGKAILNYRRAEELIGKNRELEHNLAYARRLCRTQIEPSGEQAVLHTVFFWHYNTSVTSRYALGFVAFIVFWLLMAFRVFRRNSGLTLAAIICLVFWLANGVSVGLETIHNTTTVEGVVTSNEVVVRKGNGEHYAPQVAEPIHEGVEFIVKEGRGGWYRIELPDGSSGWIRQSQAELI